MKERKIAESKKKTPSFGGTGKIRNVKHIHHTRRNTKAREHGAPVDFLRVVGWMKDELTDWFARNMGKYPTYKRGEDVRKTVYRRKSSYEV